MKNGLIKFGIFVSGLGIGSGVTYKLLKDRYEQITQDAIDEVKEMYKPKSEPKEDKHDKADVKEDKSKAVDYTKYVNNINDLGYDTETEDEDEIELDKKHYRPIITKEGKEEAPHVISPEEFGEIDGYSRISLTYYSDGYLADENDELVENVEFVVGEDYAEHFGDYEDDSVFIRNDVLRSDYEILADKRSYADLVRRKPHQI